MKATDAQLAVFRGAGTPFEIMTRALPDRLGYGECLVEIDLATICGSDLHTVEGKRIEPVPAVLGHEAVGRVTAVGEGRDPSLAGARVTWTLADSCGVCRACRQWALPQKCGQLFKYGHAPLSDAHGLNGCYASHVVLRRGTTVFPLPDKVSNAMAAPANCALATMAAVTETAGGGGELAVVQGAGLLGLFGFALLRRKGWRRVVVVDGNAARLEIAAAMGGEVALRTAEGVVERGTADLVIEAAGSPSVIEEGIRLLRPGGRYELAGMVHPDSRLGLTGETIIRKCLTLHGTHNYAPRHLKEALKFLEEDGRRLPWDRLVSPPFRLTDVNAAMEMARLGRWHRVSIQPGHRTG